MVAIFAGRSTFEANGLDLSRAVPLTGKAGSVTFHHVRMVHGSDLNRSQAMRRFLLFQYTAVDAFPLVNFNQDLDAYNQLIVAGEPTLVPRLQDVPIRLPLPPAPYQGSIYENQRTRGNPYFEPYN